MIRKPIAVVTHTGRLLGVFPTECSILPHVAMFPRREASRREVNAAISGLRRNLSYWVGTGRTDDTTKSLISRISKNIDALGGGNFSSNDDEEEGE